MAKFKLDDTDHDILEMLIENTRTPFTDIAKKLNISAGTVHVRVKKMEEANIIQVLHLLWITKIRLFIHVCGYFFE